MLDKVQFFFHNLGDNFETVASSSDAVDRVAGASFAFYENTYFLKEAVVKRQLRFQINKKNATSNNTQEARDIASKDRSLHIMNYCIINMPVSIGLQKNSPIKPRVDKLIRRVLEAGLIKKWLDDVMQRVLNANLDLDNTPSKAIMSMKKLYEALVALFIGYFIGLVGFIVEILYFKYKVKRHPSYNKYSRSVKEVKKAD
ncbi:unnamed protein product [Brassicogethes aeneus]|uniref:Ionotropic receptor n=1 Tax=Brassicogethes aeneus TaxID=1431903 RepID=A0A9P0B5Q8_BRAAE|nr:unnamed protein product [Brassicogethes aeneus]